MIFSLVTYLTPMLGMAFCYWQIGKNLWGGEVIGESNLARSAERVKHE